jgi:RNA polymerase sigma factor (sigma-70 family)
LPDSIPYDENDILPQIILGDSDAFKRFFKHYWTKILANAQQFTKQPELAEDLAQEVFLKIWKNRSNLRQVNSLEAYLYSVAKNLFLDHLKKKVLDISNIEYLQEWIRDHSDNAAKRLETRELEGAIAEAIKQLPPQMKAVFLLSRVEGLTINKSPLNC